MNRPPPNGHFIRDFLVWGTFRKRSTIAKGFVIYPPDLRGAGEGAALRAHENLVKYGHKLAALDGEIGSVKDFYFDDKTWTIRYLVADTEPWLPERLVLLYPHAFAHGQ